jgi:large subunit ribosomal protein L28
MTCCDFAACGVVRYPVSVARASAGHLAEEHEPAQHNPAQHNPGVTVAAVCDICAKSPGFGNNRPWSRKITKRRFNPNIQRVRATVNGAPKRLHVCTGCLKAGKVTR